jgi:ferrochelatase
MEALENIAKGFPRLAALPKTVIPAYPVDSNYIAALSGTISEKIREIPEDEEATILFSAHGIPEFMVTKENDPYQKDTESTCQAAETYLRREFPHRKLVFSLAYQSRVGPLKWLGPETKATISSLAHNGTTNLILVPVSFVSDHQETLYEMDILYRDLASTLPLKRFLRAPALNTRADFISGLQVLVMSALSGEKTSCQNCSCHCGACP